MRLKALLRITVGELLILSQQILLLLFEISRLQLVIQHLRTKVRQAILDLVNLLGISLRVLQRLIAASRGHLSAPRRRVFQFGVKPTAHKQLTGLRLGFVLARLQIPLGPPAQRGICPRRDLPLQAHLSLTAAQMSSEAGITNSLRNLVNQELRLRLLGLQRSAIRQRIIKLRGLAFPRSMLRVSRGQKDTVTFTLLRRAELRILT